MDPKFTVDVEWPYHAVLPPSQWPSNPDHAAEDVLYQLSDLLWDYKVLATFYVVGDLACRMPQVLRRLGSHPHHFGSHGYWHRHQEREGDRSDQLTRKLLPECVGYRSPFWDTTPRPGWSGGFFFRTLPYGMLKHEIQRTGMFYCHPHDFYDAKIGPWRRHLFRCNPWERLRHLLEELPFERN